MSNFYELLEVSQNATKEEIKQAFRKKARQWHPDVNKAPDAEEKFKELGRAYETLMDDNKRAVYDRYGEDGLNNAGYTSGPFDFGFGDLNDIFSSFFGGFGGFGGSYAQNPNAPVNGSDLRLDIPIEFEEAVFGIEKEIKIDHLEPCEECSGSGIIKGAKETTCQMCKGHGRVQQSTRTILGSFTSVTACPGCKGTGRSPGANCKACKGEGTVSKEKTIKIKIPAGVDHGANIRVSHQGDAGKNGGAPGDLYIVLHVKDSKKFIRKGTQIHSELEISFPQAVLGFETTIETLDGECQIVIPQGISNLDTISIKGAGVPFLGRDSQRGEHIVTVKIKTPIHLNDEEKKLYKRLAELEQNKSESILNKVKGAFASR